MQNIHRLRSLKYMVHFIYYGILIIILLVFNNMNLKVTKEAWCLIFCVLLYITGLLMPSLKTSCYHSVGRFECSNEWRWGLMFLIDFFRPSISSLWDVATFVLSLSFLQGGIYLVKRQWFLSPRTWHRGL